ncbi:DUF4097 family beta strand repeat-containing protein [Streptomyces caniscabiei]|uniref:DUF4097 family beta strand repeat-containing protein n=1 Tax=Streptomyces TaxID=1883 RepID=UPI0029A6BC79|nr:DUF4097 family beta strand repeat-containing protein [Streptomyces caniscabiei]MDX2599663.1 DUF4097 family beta strand repeat-containing protein [Streptomyces caniscabiei]MDX2735042.1 DUF4097 family beta strand repeat-containing protein [Streptomyces caniscabiei]MDX2776738.1 DUF4097 family beta strand repeat-containing protein [Streptomyces caniscabiei]
MYDTLASARSGPRLPGRPKTSALRRVIRILAILTCVTLVGGAAWYLLMFLVTDTESDSSAISTSVRNVELTIDSGDIEVDVVGQGEKPELHKELTRSLRSPDETIKQEGDTLHVTTRCGDGVGRCASDYRLTVPADTVINVRTGMGDVSVKGVRASAEGRTQMGDVHVEHVTGDRLVAVSKTGDITLRDVKFDTAEATTKLGDVVVEDIDVFKKLTALSKTGDVEVNLPENAGPFAVDADTSIGDRKVTVDQDSSSGTSVDARTKIGDVTVRTD